jgi:hypothetical protein
MRITLEDFLDWQEKNMYKYDNKNIVLTYYLNVHKGNIYNRRVIECGYCKKIFVQKIRMQTQKYCSWGCNSAASQFRSSLKRKLIKNK